MVCGSRLAIGRLPNSQGKSGQLPVRMSGATLRSPRQQPLPLAVFVRTGHHGPHRPLAVSMGTSPTTTSGPATPDRLPRKAAGRRRRSGRTRAVPPFCPSRDPWPIGGRCTH